jgi:molybdenum cofactor biosynthesis enzyme MoaA
MASKTTVQVSYETLDRMKNARITKRESYDEIINRLIDKMVKPQ